MCLLACVRESYTSTKHKFNSYLSSCGSSPKRRLRRVQRQGVYLGDGKGSMARPWEVRQGRGNTSKGGVKGDGTALGTWVTVPWGPMRL